MVRHLSIALLATASVLAGCTGSKSYAKKGEKLDVAGLYAEAAGMFEEAARRSTKNVEAKIGLKKNGQLLLNDKLSAFFKSMAMGTAKGDAVNAYLDAKAYQDRIGRLGVVLEIPDHYKVDFERVKDEYLVELYNEGQALMAKEDYKAAEQVFARIARLEPNYKDASSLQSIAYLEPLYRSGKADLAAGAFRKAYAALDQVVKRDAGYKDAAALRQECVTKGQYTIAVLPFSSAIKRADISARLQGNAITALTEARDPFLKVVDRENLERILEEQRLGLSGVVDEQTAVRVGNLMGAQAVLIGTVTDYREEAGNLRQSTRNGFEAYRVEMVNKETGEKYLETRYRPARYTEFYQENKVFLSVNYRLVSMETGEVLVSKTLDKQADDHMYYANYDGNREALLPALNGAVDPNDRARRELRTLLNAPRTIKSTATMGSELVRTASSQLASTIQAELNSRLP
ncbi:MAG: CsgG/HfaB family protein [Flavobacteriales bacterium]|jgi:curli biogenesis system outer membrane secretion channel CsgG|nr:MAG: CsgG/HfaB family protein [Flavobacteriales bacterium]